MKTAGRVPMVSGEQFLKDIDQLAAWRYILGQNVDLNQYITSPLRIDTRPKCYLREGRGGYILLADFANGNYHNWSCIQVFQHLEGLGYREAKSILYSVIKNGYEYRRISRPNITVGDLRPADFYTGFQIDYVPYKDQKGNPTFTTLDKDYWSPRQVSSKQLLEDGVHSVYAFFVPWTNEILKDRCYAYNFFNGHTKLYFPDRKKFISTCTENDVWDWSKGSTTRTAVYCKSYKDGRMFKNMFPEYRVYAFQNEGCVPYHLEDMVNFHDENYFFFDNDKGGINAMTKMLNMYPKAHAFTVPKYEGVTDFDELFLLKGERTTYNIIKNTINEAKNSTGILVPRT